MQSLKDTVLVKHNCDTLEVVRKEFSLHHPGRMDEAIDRLHEWVAAQPHFNKKNNYSRKYLEVFIINAKGSVEKAKEYIEKLCAYKTFGPQYFAYSTKPIDLKGLENIDCFFLPRLTKENYRIFFVRNCTQKNYTVQVILSYLTKAHFMLEYLIKNNYSSGIEVIFDFRKTEISYFISAIKYTESRNGFLPMFKGYAARVKSIYIISTSKIIDLLVTAVSQIISLKMLGRIHVHANIEELYEHFDKDLLPSDYGGMEKTTKELCDDWNKELSTDEFMEYIKDMFTTTINPSLKPIDTFNELFTGTQGTFRTLSID